MNYGDFKTQVAAYLHRSDLTSMIPTFIEHGRIRLFAELRASEMETTATVTLTSGEGTLPDDLVDIRWVKGSTYGLRRVTLEEIPYYTTEGVYAVRGLTLLAPAMSSVTVAYYARPESFVGDALGDAATRPMLDAYPHLWLQAALVEAYRYTEDAEAEARAFARLAQEVESVNYRASELRQGASPVVMGPYTQGFGVATR